MPGVQGRQGRSSQQVWSSYQTLGGSATSGDLRSLFKISSFSCSSVAASLSGFKVGLAWCCHVACPSFGVQTCTQAFHASLEFFLTSLFCQAMRALRRRGGPLPITPCCCLYLFLGVTTASSEDLVHSSCSSIRSANLSIIHGSAGTCWRVMLCLDCAPATHTSLSCLVVGGLGFALQFAASVA